MSNSKDLIIREISNSPLVKKEYKELIKIIILIKFLLNENKKQRNSIITKEYNGPLLPAVNDMNKNRGISKYRYLLNLFLLNIIINEEEYVVLGDINEDGVLNIVDVVALLNIFLSNDVLHTFKSHITHDSLSIFAEN